MTYGGWFGNPAPPRMMSIPIIYRVFDAIISWGRYETPVNNRINYQPQVEIGRISHYL